MMTKLIPELIAFEKEYEDHPTGIKLTRVGYYTIPNLDDLKSYLAEDGSCVVPNFTIGRTGYGNVYFPKEIDVANLNIDEIVHFRNKEITVYPDDENKPPIGTGLNRDAQVTLDKVWPLDKTKQEPITDPDRLVQLNWEERLRRVCDKNETRFVEYRPETGSWVFRVKHFTKYGLNDSDEEDVVPVDPKKAIILAQLKSKANGKALDRMTRKFLENKLGKLAEPMPMDPTKSLQQQNTVSASVFDPRSFAESPSSILTKASGINPHKIQQMKVLFFGDDDTQSVQWNGTDPGTKNDITGGYVKKKAKLPEFVITPKVAMVKKSIFQIPYRESLCFALTNKCIADVSLMNSRMFKFNFGPANTFIVPVSKNELCRTDVINENLAEACTKIFRLRKAQDFSQTMLQQIKLRTTQYYDKFEESIVVHLKIQLENANIGEVEGSECPYIRPQNGPELIEKHEKEAIALRDLSKYGEFVTSVWSLCSLLWGSFEDLEHEEESSHFGAMFRRNLLSQWLENTVSEYDSSKVYLDRVMDLILSHKIDEAADLAFKCNFQSLSALIGFMSSGAKARQIAQRELLKWQEEAEFVHVESWKIFMIAAGIPLISSINGPISLMEDLYWLKAFAMHLWYLSSPSETIENIVLAYCRALQTEEAKAEKPTPPYFNEHYANQHKRSIYDVRFHLLSLFSDRSHSLESLLNPSTHTPDVLDFRLSWLLLQTLKALGYAHCSELSESQIHTGFAAQLETYNLWEWAVFVLLHIKNKNQREIAVQNLLYRYVTITKDTSLTEKELFVVEQLGVPEKWINYAKSVKAGSQNNYQLQAKYLLKAKQWNLAHELIFEHIAPDEIINNNLNNLKALLSEFACLDLQQNVSNWSCQGQVLLDFIDIKEKFEILRKLRNTNDIKRQWEQIKPRVVALASSIRSMPCPNNQYFIFRLRTIKFLAQLLKRYLVLETSEDFEVIIDLILARLPNHHGLSDKDLLDYLKMIQYRLTMKDGLVEVLESIIV